MKKKSAKRKSKRKIQKRRNPGGGWKFNGTFASKWDAYRPGMGGMELRDKKLKEWFLATGRIVDNEIFVERIYPTPVKNNYKYIGLFADDWVDWRMGFNSEMTELENKKGIWWTADIEFLRSRIKTINVLNIFNEVRD